MKKIFKKIFGIDKLESEITAAVKQKMEAEIEAELAKKEAERAKEEERLAKLSPKELATEKKEPYVTVLETHVNKEDIRHGFFDLDWNEYFVLELKAAGYKGSTDEEIVGNWFNEICKNLAGESGIDMERRSAGYINVNNLPNGKSEIF